MRNALGITTPCWVRHPCLLLDTLQPSVIQSILTMNRNLPFDTPWHTSTMTAAGRVNVLLGYIQEEPWLAPTVEEYVSQLHNIFLPQIVDGLRYQIIDSEKSTRSTENPYKSASFTERLIVSVLNRLEERHISRVRQLRMTGEPYTLPAGLELRRVPEWVKNPILLYSDCRSLMVKIIKAINQDMPADSDWWRDDFLSTPDRVHFIVRRIKCLFNRHIMMPDYDGFLPRLSFEDTFELEINDPETEIWETSPHKTASLIGSLFRRHIAVTINDQAMKFDYTVPGFPTKNR